MEGRQSAIDDNFRWSDVFVKIDVLDDIFFLFFLVFSVDYWGQPGDISRRR